MSGAETHNPKSLQPLPDEELVIRAQTDLAAFDAIFDLYWNPVLRYCYYRLGNWHQAEDAAAQVFVNAIAALPAFTSSGQTNAFKSWLFTIAFRLVSNLRRAEARHPSTGIEAAELTAAPDDPLDDLAIASEEQQTLFRLIEQLKPDQRQVVEMRLAGLADAEIAQVLQKSPVAVRKTQSRAVIAMRELLEAQYQQGGGGRHV